MVICRTTLLFHIPSFWDGVKKLQKITLAEDAFAPFFFVVSVCAISLAFYSVTDHTFFFLEMAGVVQQ